MNAPFSRTLFDLLREQAQARPDALAVICGESGNTASDSPSTTTSTTTSTDTTSTTSTTSTSYAALLARVQHLAGALRAAGVARGDRIGLLVSNRIEWIEIFFASAAVGAVLVPFSTWSKPRELAFLLQDSGASMLFVQDRLGKDSLSEGLLAVLPQLAEHQPGGWQAPDFPQLRCVVMIGETRLAGALGYAEFAGAGAPITTTITTPMADPLAPGDGAAARDVSTILYTSGSTAYPKAVPMQHAAMIENGFNIGERQGLRAGDRVLLALPLFWSYGCANAACATFTHGATLVLQERFEPAGALELIERHAVTAIYTLPGMTAALVTHPDFTPARTASLRTGLTIGAPRDVETAALVLGASEICNIYGQTESYGNCCVTWHHWPLARRQAVQGPPLPGVTVRIVDVDTGAVLPAGAQGLIEVTGYLTPGYAGKSQAQNTTAFTDDGFFRTGDLGCLTTDGDMQFAGRDGEMIKRAGINIAPAEVEELLQKHPGVALAGVTGAPDPDKGEAIVAFVVARPGQVLEPDELRRFCRAEASNYKAPDRIEICSSLPQTPTGKLLRRELRALAVALPALTRN